jgi:hypothetical protein
MSLFSQVTTNSLTTENDWYRTWDGPWWSVLLLLIVLLAFGIWAYGFEWRRQRMIAGVLMVLRWGLMSSLVVLAMGWFPKTLDVESPEVLLCLDLSESMGQRIQDSKQDGDADTRLDALVEAYNNSGLANQKRWNLRAYSIGHELADLEMSDGKLPEGLLSYENQSRLGEGLQQLLTQCTGRPVAAVVLMSDGITTQGKTLEQIDRFIKRSNIPIFAVAMEPEIPLQDASLGHVTSPGHALVGENVLFKVPVFAQELEGRELLVQMRRVVDNELLQEQKWTPGEGRDETMLEFLQSMDLPGPQSFRFDVQLDGDDFNRTNDEQRIQVQVHEMQQRVLVVSGGANWEFRFLKHTLERSIREVEEASLSPFELHVLLQDSDPKFSEIDASALSIFPVSAESLEQYDVIMLVNPLTTQESPTRGLSVTDCEHLLDYVQNRGGNLVWVAGVDFKATQWGDLGLGPLMPAHPSDFQSSSDFMGSAETVGVQRSKLGEAMGPLQLQRVESPQPFDWNVGWRTGQFTLPAQVRPGTRILLESEELLPIQRQPAPLLMLRNVGAGSVLFQGFDEAYRLRYQRGDQVLNAYWSQWIQYLAKRRWLSQRDWQELSTDRWIYLEGEPVRVIAQTVDDVGPEGRIEVKVSSDSGFQTELELLTGEPGPLDFTGELVGLLEGNYRVQLMNRRSGEVSESEFVVRTHPAEDEVVAVNRVGLAHVAEISGGDLVELDDFAQLRQRLPPGSPRVVGHRVGAALWDRPAVLGFLGAVWVGLLLLEWIVRDWKRP